MHKEKKKEAETYSCYHWQSKRRRKRRQRRIHVICGNAQLQRSIDVICGNAQLQRDVWLLSVAVHNYRETYGCYLSQCTITERRIDDICGNAQCIDVSVAMHNYRETYSVICGNAQLQRDV